MKIEGITALVTGAASGLGSASSHALAQKGATVCMLDLDTSSTTRVAAELGGAAFDCDVTSAGNMESVVAQVVKDIDLPRVLVNCAGIAPARRIVDRQGAMPLDNFKRVIDVNLNGTFNAMRVMVAAIRNEAPLDDTGERGVIINVASVSAFEGQVGQAAYSSSKGAVLSLTVQAARELASAGIRVMSIAPGLMNTPMLKGMPEAVQQSLAAQVPFPKRLGDPDEFARLVVHIIENQMLNGENIRLDGAIRMQPK